jgi:chromosome segregation ATPase
MKDLLRIASLLDNSGHFGLSDKLFKIAQQVQGNFGQLTLTEQNRKLEELNYAMRQNTQKLKELMASYNKGSIDRTQFEQMGQNLNQQANALMAEYKRIEQQSNNFTLYAQNQQQNENLISYSPEDFAKKLIDFREEYNIKNLAQAFDMYARSGAMYGNNPLSRDPRLQKLYQKILQTPRFIYEEEIVSELTNIISGID